MLVNEKKLQTRIATDTCNIWLVKLSLPVQIFQRIKVNEISIGIHRYSQKSKKCHIVAPDTAHHCESSCSSKENIQ